MQCESNNQEVCTQKDNRYNDSNITEKLILDTDEIFNQKLAADDSSAVLSEKIPTTTSTNSNIVSIPDAQWYDEYGKKLLAIHTPIIWEYHKSEIDNVNKIINSILSLSKWVSILTIFLVAIFAFLGKDTGAIISGIVGIIIDGILGTLAGLFNSTLKSKKSYFDSANNSAKFNQMLLIVQTISDQSKKDNVISKIVCKHFGVSDDK